MRTPGEWLHLDAPELAIVSETLWSSAHAQTTSQRARYSQVPNYTTHACVVRRWSTIRVSGRTYSVPARLIGHTVEARQHPRTVEVLYRGHVDRNDAPAAGRGGSPHRVPPHYWELGAQAWRLRAVSLSEELFPSLTFRQAYDALCLTHGERADVDYVRQLQLAATTS
jgi:hypothetical protein